MTAVAVNEGESYDLSVSLPCVMKGKREALNKQEVWDLISGRVRGEEGGASGIGQAFTEGWNENLSCRHVLCGLRWA